MQLERQFVVCNCVSSPSTLGGRKDIMGIFSKKSDVDAYYSSLNSKNYEDDDGNDDYDCEIVFDKELSNGTLVFNIIDDDYDPAGHVIVSSGGTIKIIESTFYDLDKNERNYLENQAKKFYDASR